MSGVNPSYIALQGATLFTLVFALWKGDRATRIAAITNTVLAGAALLTNPRAGDVSYETISLALDFACAVIFLLLAVRYANLWLGAAMILQAAQFSMHAYYLVMEMPHDRMHAWINNTDDWGILVAISVGTVLAMRRREALAREAAEREALRQERAARVR